MTLVAGDANCKPSPASFTNSFIWFVREGKEPIWDSAEGAWDITPPRLTAGENASVGPDGASPIIRSWVGLKDYYKNSFWFDLGIT
jgi:hypothetical protein